ncbi:hypothetical protein [Nocardiopsis ganjiahuensis]|uniref:hypothetical protein n=1 Tax=Nocardiopsis ganjiahuensis TaxID=239984 RepID=UPI00034763DC|nr:hypothetical protein [Nocardiopsis ganjiahuensis]
MTPEPVSAYLPLRYVLSDSLAVRTSFDPLRVDSETTLSGRAQRGMLAAALRRAGLEDELTEWVARGEQVRFAPAHPRLEQHARDGVQVVAHPPPAHLYTPGKDGDTLVDVFAEGADRPGVPYRAVRDPLTPDRSLRAAVRTTAERYLGRSRTGEPGQGVPFFTTSLDPGQVFEARWQLRGPDQAFLRELAERIVAVLGAAEGTLTLGSGGTRAHGGVVVEPVHPDRLLSPDRVERPRADRSRRAGQEIDLLLLSPALLVGAQGQERPHALVPAVRELLARRLPSTPVAVVAAHVEPVLLGAYHRAYRGPMAQRWAAAPGSVVRLRPGRDLTTGHVRHLEAHPLGERLVDGYGQFVLAAPPPSRPEPLSPPSEPVPARRAGTVTLPDGRVLPEPAPLDPGRDPELGALYDELLWNAAAPRVRGHARALAQASADTLPPLTPSLLGRLREVVAHPGRTADEALTVLGRTLAGAPPGAGGSAGPGQGRAAPKVLGERAVRALGRARLVRPGQARPVTVHAWLSGLSGGPAAVAWWSENRPRPVGDPAYARALAAVDLASPDGLPPTTRESGLSSCAESWESRASARLCLLLVSSWLAEAARVLRTEQAGTDRDGGGPR